MSEEPKSGSLKVLWIVLASVISTIVIAGLVFMVIYYKNKADSADQVSATKSPSSQSNASSADETSTPVTTLDMDTAGNSPTDITENFILYTLGTVPGANVNYDKARTLMSANILDQYTEDDDSFVTDFYGIQQGPDTYEMREQTVNGDEAVVRVDVLYGEMMQAWAFGLYYEFGGWKVDSLRKDAQ